MTQRKKPVNTDKKPQRGKGGKFAKGNSIQNKLDPEVKCIRAAVKTEIARVTNLLTKPKKEADAVLDAPDATHLHSIMKDALEKKKYLIVQDFIDRTIGKPTQETKVAIDKIPDDQLLEMLREAMEDMN